MTETRTTQREIFNAIFEERIYQDATQGGREHDETHDLGDWTKFIGEHVSAAKHALNRPSPSREECKAELIQIAALCVAALEVHGIHFDPKHREKLNELYKEDHRRFPDSCRSLP